MRASWPNGPISSSTLAPGDERSSRGRSPCFVVVAANRSHDCWPDVPWWRTSPALSRRKAGHAVTHRATFPVCSLARPARPRSVSEVLPSSTVPHPRHAHPSRIPELLACPATSGTLTSHAPLCILLLALTVTSASYLLNNSTNTTSRPPSALQASILIPPPLLPFLLRQHLHQFFQTKHLPSIDPSASFPNNNRSADAYHCLPPL